MSREIQEQQDQVRLLIKLGKEQGYLLYDQVNDAFAAEEHTNEEIDSAFTALSCEHQSRGFVDLSRSSREIKSVPFSHVGFVPKSDRSQRHPARAVLLVGTVVLLFGAGFFGRRPREADSAAADRGSV